MKYRLLPRLVSMLVVWLLLLAWQLNAARLGALGNLPFLLLLAAPIAMSGIEATFARRHAFRNECLLGSGWLYRLLGLVLPVLLVEGAKGLLLATVLMIATLSLQLRDWVLLLIDVFVLSLLMPRLPGLLHDVVKPTYLYALARRWAVWFSTLLLWGGWLLALLLSGNDDFRGLSWSAAVSYSITPVVGIDDAGLISLLLRLNAAADGVAAWSSYRLLHDALSPADALAALLALMAVFAVWFLVAWAYSRALIGALSRPLAIWFPRQRRDGGAFETWWS